MNHNDTLALYDLGTGFIATFLCAMLVVGALYGLWCGLRWLFERIGEYVQGRRFMRAYRSPLAAAARREAVTIPQPLRNPALRMDNRDNNTPAESEARFIGLTGEEIKA